jgi:hypothetical protein
MNSACEGDVIAGLDHRPVDPDHKPVVYFFERLFGLRSFVLHFLHFFAFSGLLAPQNLQIDLYSK